MSIFKIKGVVQDYAWGGKTFISRLIEAPQSIGKCAEYWMGAHENASSTILETGESLLEIIKNDPHGILGSEVATEFGRLPFLFKVLDVKEMLSIQVHPTKEEAREGFARENSEGIPLTAPHRNYKDDNHKPEIMVALSEFWLLHGFKPRASLKETLAKTPELNSLVNIFDKEGYIGLYKSVMEEPPEKTIEVILPLINRLKPKYEAGLLSKDSADYWAIKAFNCFCSMGNIDKGIYSIYFLT